MKKNVSGQRIGAQLVSATDGSAFTGSVTVSVCGDAGTQATGSVGSGVCTHEGNGYHTYAPAQAETNFDLIAFTFIGSGAVPVTVQVYTRPTTGLLAPTVDGRTLDVSSGGEAGIDLANVGSPTTTLNLSGTTISTSQAVASVSGNVTGSVGSVVGGMGGNVGGSVANVVGTVNANVTQVNSSSTAAANMALINAGFEAGTAQAGGASTITLRSAAIASNDYYKDQVIYLTGGTGAGQTNRITAYVGSTKVATVGTAWVTQPDNTSTYVVLGRVG